MKNSFLISIILVFIISCYNLRNSQSKVMNEKKGRNIDYCQILDSLRMLPKYDYRLVKGKTKIYNVPIQKMIDTNDLRKYKQEGYRIVIFAPTVPKPYVQDSFNYVQSAHFEAKKIFEIKLKDSILRVNPKNIDNYNVSDMTTKRLSNLKCK